MSKSLKTLFFVPPCAFLLWLDITFRLDTSSLSCLLSSGIYSVHIYDVTPHLSEVNSLLSTVRFFMRSHKRTGG